MKRIFVLVISLLGLLVVFAVVRSLSINPDTGTFLANSNATFDIAANLPGTTPVSTIDEIFFDFQTSGGTVVGYTPPVNPVITPIGECPDGETTCGNRVYVHLLRSSGYFTEEDDLGSFVVLWGSAGAAAIISTDNSMYVDNFNDDTYLDSGTIGQFTITNFTGTPTAAVSVTPTGRIPETAIEDGGIALSFGLVFSITGLFLYKYASKNYKTT